MGVVFDDRVTPRPNTTLRFIDDDEEVVLVKADYTGRFAVELPAGEWTLYIPGTAGKPAFIAPCSSASRMNAR